MVRSSSRSPRNGGAFAPANPEHSHLFKYGDWVPRSLVIDAMRWVDLPEEKIIRVMEMTGPNLITLRQAAASYDVPYQTVRKWVSEGRLPKRGTHHNPLGGPHLLVDEREFIEVLRGSRVKSKARKKILEALDPVRDKLLQTA